MKIMSNLNDFKNKKIALLGLGIENISLLRFLILKKVDCEITVCDFRSEEKLGKRYDEFKNQANVVWQLGMKFNRKLYKFDLMLRSPGWSIKCPGIQEALAKEVELSSPIKIFFDLCPTKNIIGVTGTKGKGTISSLIYEILKTDEREVFLGGNIGVAPFDFFKDLKKDTLVVLELSSFHLEDMDKSPRIAVFSNFTPEHLSAADPNNPNYHESLGEYWKAKTNIFKWQDKDGVLVVNNRLESKIKSQGYDGELISFSSSEMKSNLVGEHNKENIAAAKEVGVFLDIKMSIIKKAVAGFKGLPYRTEFIKEVDGVKFYNDSFATTPEATIIGLRAFKEPIILLAGGSDKGSDFLKLAKEVKGRVKTVVLFFGIGSDKIKKELNDIRYNQDDISEVGGMEEAFQIIRSKFKKGDVVLLSTACASFGVFKNYKERGRLFNEEVMKL